MKKKKVNKTIIYYAIFIFSALLIIFGSIFSATNYNSFKNYKIAKEYYDLNNNEKSFNELVQDFNSEFSKLTNLEKEQKTKESIEFLKQYPTFNDFKKANPTLTNKELAEYKYYQFNYYYTIDGSIFIVSLFLLSLGLTISISVLTPFVLIVKKRKTTFNKNSSDSNKRKNKTVNKNRNYKKQKGKKK